MSHRPSRFKSDLNFAIEEKLREAGIEIPFPQRDLHIRSGTLPSKTSADKREACSQRRAIEWVARPELATSARLSGPLAIALARSDALTLFDARRPDPKREAMMHGKESGQRS